MVYDAQGNAIVSENNRIIKALSYNVGNFANGGTGGYTGNDLTDYIGNWARFIGGYDVCFFSESRKHIDSSNSTLSDSGLYSKLYDHILAYNPSEDWGVALLTNDSQSATQTKKFTNQSSSESKYAGALISINGIDVYVVVVHFVHGSATATRIAQMTELINAVSAYDNVIIGGDFNTSDITEVATLENAGFTFANGGVWGINKTYSVTDPQYPLDNIGVRGDNLKIKAFTPLSDIALSDHMPIVAEIEIA